MSGVLKQINDAGSESILFAHKAFNLLQKKLPQEALELCQEGVKRFPFYVEGHFIMARSYQALERFKAAIAEYETVLHYMPGYVKALKALAWLYLKEGKEEKAHNLLRSFALYDPLNTELVQFLKSNGLYQFLYEPPAGPSVAQEQPVVEEETLDSGFDDENEEDLFGAPASAYEDVPVLNLEGDDLPPLDSGMETEEKPEPEFPAEIDADTEFDRKEDEQKEYERNSIVDNLDEAKKSGGGVNLDQFDNTEDDFSTVMDGVFHKAVEDEMNQEEDVFIDPGEPQEAEPEVMIEERPLLDTSIIFNEGKQKTEDVDDHAAVDDFENLAAELERQSFEEAEAIEESMIEAIGDEETPTTPEAEKPLEAEEMPEEQPVTDLIEEFPEQEAEMEADQIEEILELDEENSLAEGEDELLEIDEEGSVVEDEDEKILIAQELEDADESIEITEDKQTEQVQAEAAQLTAEQKLIDENEQASVDDILSNPSLLTLTFGEILIAQKKFEDARQVFIELSNREPDNIRFKKKIEFLEKLVAMGKRN